MARNLVMKDARVRAFEERPEVHQRLRVWSESDFVRLNLTRCFSINVKQVREVSDVEERTKEQSSTKKNFQMKHRIGR